MSHSIIYLPRSLQRRIDGVARGLLGRQDRARAVFSHPLNEPALTSADSVSWRIFKNPVALVVGGIAAVILELAEPSVRTGVWAHSSFRSDPPGRLRRTGLAAMITVYGARSVSEPMIAAVARRHATIAGITPAGIAYSASDPRLLTWVHATAAFGFANAYSRYVDVLDDAQFDALYGEGAPAARLYGASGAPTTQTQMRALFSSMRGRLEPSPVVFEFLRIMSRTAALPGPLRWIQPALVRAAVELVPDWIRDRIGLNERFGLRPGERWWIRLAGNVSNRIVIGESPAVQSCVRLGLSRHHLYA